jgi:ABC-type glycerol-3-phosphate transport system permease component
MPFYIIYLSCIWAFIYILKYFLFLWIVISLFSSKAEQKDALNNIVLSAYLHLQSDGFLTTWTNSFVGPWDPSQGEHNPGNKLIIKCITCLQQFFNSIFVTFGLN